MRGRRLALSALAGASILVGAWALALPASFYGEFVLGRGWVAADGPYNEHLTRDVGALNLALAAVLLAARLRMEPTLIRVAAVAAMVYGIPHLAYHATHLEPFGLADAVAQTVVLAALVVVPAWLAWAPHPRRPEPPPSDRAASPPTSGPRP